MLIRAPKPLLKLLRLCPYLDGVFPEGGEVPDFDYHLPLLSLPVMVGTTLTTVPAGEPYLFADRCWRSVGKGSYRTSGRSRWGSTGKVIRSIGAICGARSPWPISLHWRPCLGCG